MDQNEKKRRAAEAALAYVEDDTVVGVGTGSTVNYFIDALADIKARIDGAVSSSQASTKRLEGHGIPVVDLNTTGDLGIYVDGADEATAHGYLIKGGGGALTREKIVAAASERLVIVVGSEKLVPLLGTRGILPVEIVPFGLVFCRSQLLKLECDPSPRVTDGRLFQTDNGNHILDCKISVLTNPAELEQAIQAVPGVVGTGLFLGMAHTVLVQDGEEVEILERGSS